MATSNWGFEDANWTLNTVTYKVAPSSLEFNGSYVADDGTLAIIDCNNIVEGRITTWLRFDNDTTTLVPALFFRCQGTKASPTADNCYLAQIRGASNTIYIYSVTTGFSSMVNLGSASYTMSKDTWYKIRITWWEGYDLSNNLATVFRIEQDTDDNDSWTQLGSDIYDTNRRNWNSSVNNCGVGCYNDTGAATSQEILFETTIIESA